MAPARREKVASSLRGELARVIQMEMNDPRVGFITVTAVDVSPDLRVAKVYITTLADPARRDETLAALEQARGFLRRRVADNLALRRTPELRFRLDGSGDRAARIDHILKDLDVSGGEEPGPDDEDAR